MRLNAGFLRRVMQTGGFKGRSREVDPEGMRAMLARRYGVPDAWIVAEKILEPGERLRETWQIAGTTGYDFMNRVSQLFVDPAAERTLTDFYVEFTGESADLAEVVRQCKDQISIRPCGLSLPASPSIART